MIKKFNLSTAKILFYIVLLAAILRLLGLFGEFDIDEAWAFFKISGLHSPWGIFSKLNMTVHPLNGLFMYFIGKGNAALWFKFRILSYFFGVLNVYLTYLISIRLFPSKEWRLIVTALIASSFPLVVYSCSAMGYSMVIFFSLLSFLSVYEFIGSNSIKWLFIYYLASFFGFLSHVNYVYVFAGLVGMAVYSYFTSFHEPKYKDKVFSLVKISLPFWFIILFYFNFLHKAFFETGTSLSYVQIVSQLGAYLTGLPWQMPFIFLMAGLVCLVLAYEIFYSFRDGRLLGVFVAVCIVTVCLECMIRRPAFYYFRYLLSFYPFLIILFSSFLNRIVEKYKSLKMPALMLVLLIFCGNIIYDIQFIKEGSGHYLESLDYIAKNNQDSNISISSNAERVDLINFYHLFRPAMKIIYVPFLEIKEYAPEWFIAYSYTDKPITFPYLKFGSIQYGFEKSFLYAGNGLMGSYWSIYHMTKI